MPRVRVKKIKQHDSAEISKVFNQLTGVEAGDEKVIAEKFKLVKKKMLMIKRVLDIAVSDVFTKFTDCKDITDYTCSIEALFVDAKYENVKSSPVVKHAVLTCSTLMEYKISPKTDSSFITRMPGFDFCPFSFSKFNVKKIWGLDPPEKVKSYILTVLKIILAATKEVYKAVTSPDIDISKFSRVIIDSISQLKKVIPRCDRAFNKLEESLSLLENNFGNYYKDFVQSKNPSTIVESFVLDVSANMKEDAQIMYQLNTIVKYYRKATQGKITDPRVRKMLDIIDSNFKAM